MAAARELMQLTEWLVLEQSFLVGPGYGSRSLTHRDWLALEAARIRLESGREAEIRLRGGEGALFVNRVAG